jgi:hypothetical protein
MSTKSILLVLILSDEVFTNLVEFYEIDIKWFDLKKELKKEQLKSNLTYRDRRKAGMDR